MKRKTLPIIDCRLSIETKSKIKFLAVALLLLFPSFAYPCSTPVFRYAMERWMADYYEGMVIQRGEIPDNDPAAMLLQGDQADLLNLRLSKVNLDDEQSWKHLAEQPADSNSTSEADSAASVFKNRLGIEIPEKLPALVLWYPWHQGRALPFWTGEFTPATIKGLMDSPKRKELARRLTDGQTAVWVLVQSGNAAKDNAALQLINHEFQTATEQLKEAAAEFPADPGTSPFKYEFSTLTISRSDPNEQMLLSMLLNSEPDLDEYAAEPVVFPVFGRGRALFALVGEGINSDNLQEAIAFITGPCGCEIKMMNPGVDLLMAVDWDSSVMKFYEEFYESQQEDMPELTSVFPEEKPVESSAATEAFAETSTSPRDDTSALLAKPSRDADASPVLDAADPVSVEDQASSTESQGSGFGVVGTTAVSVGAILVIAVLGTFAVMRKHP